MTVYAPANASPAKLAVIRNHGSELRLLDMSGLAVELAARRDAQASGHRFISPYNDLAVIAGQGTIGLELLDSAPDLDAVILAVGGGGPASGVGAALKGRGSQAQLIGAWPEASPCLMRALERGYIHNVEESETISDGTAGGIEVGSVTLDLWLEVMDRRVAVSEGEIRLAMWLIAEHERWMVEGAAGVAFAAGRRAEGAQSRGGAVRGQHHAGEVHRGTQRCERSTSGRHLIQSRSVLKRSLVAAEKRLHPQNGRRTHETRSVPDSRLGPKPAGWKFTALPNSRRGSPKAVGVPCPRRIG